MMDIKDYIIFQSAGNLYWKDVNFRYLGCNYNFCKTARINAPEKIIGKTDRELFSEFLNDEELDNLLKIDREVVLSGQTIVCEEVGINDEGEKAIFLTKKVPLKNDEGSIIGLIGTSIDITKQKMAEQVRMQFIQNMQHDIRTPSAGIWSVLSILSKKERDLHQKEILTMVAKSSKQLLDLCDDIVDFGNVDEEKKHPILEKTFDIRAMADKVLDLNKPAAFSKELILALKIDEEVPAHIKGDDYRLSRILINLVGNAIKFTDIGSVALTINIKKDYNRKAILHIEVKDTGIGIEKNSHTSIFERFIKLNPSNTSAEYKGSGLGLYVVKKYIEELEGDIHVESSIGKGSTFTVDIPVVIPLSDMNGRGVEVDEEYRSPLSEYTEEDLAISPFDFEEDDEGSVSDKPFQHKILLIEDDNMCLFAEHSMLSQLVDDIDIARTVLEAKEQLKNNEYDLVISDIGLKDGSGIDVISAAKTQLWSKNKDTPFIAVTAHRDAARHQEATAAGFKEVTTKPLTPEQARRFLENIPLSEEKAKLSVTRPILDLKLAMNRMGTRSEAKIIKSLDLLMATLSEDLLTLRQAEMKQDLMSIREVNHKIMGALNYSGTPALQKAVQDLHIALRNDDVSRISIAIKNIYEQVEFLEKEYHDLLDRRIL